MATRTENLRRSAAEALRTRASELARTWTAGLERRSGDTALAALAPQIIEAVAATLESAGSPPDDQLRHLALVRRVHGRRAHDALSDLSPFLEQVRRAAIAELRAGSKDEALTVAEDLARACEAVLREVASAWDDQPLVEALLDARTLATYGRKLNHDLRNHLYAVQMHLRLLQEERIVADPERRQQLLDRARDALGGMTSVAPDQLAAFLAVRAPAARSGVLLGVVEHLVRQVERSAREHAVEVRVEALPSVELPDADRVVVALYELLDNAIRYRSPGRAGVVVVRAREEADELALEVEDDARGIAPEVLPHVFALGNRGAEEEIPGDGAGLWLARQAVEGAGGRLEARSRPGHGSTFTMYLPLVRRPAPRPR